jgi:hypothetical protein
MLKKDETMQSAGGKARAAALSPEQRSDIAQRAAVARWGVPDSGEDEFIGPIEKLPTAEHRGFLTVFEPSVPCYVLSNGLRVIGRTSATEMLTGVKGGGALEKYIDAKALNPFISKDKLLEEMVAFKLPEVEGLGKAVKGLRSDTFVELCQGFVSAMNAHLTGRAKLTDRQLEMAAKASMFLSACAKIGLDALIDEATGYQYERAEDALQIKLRAYLTDEMRKWEKTFPEELWVEFGRLTGWSHSVTKRPKYWGKLVMELVYQYLDEDVARWLKSNAPSPRHGQNYHQWLNAQYGLKKLVEHIWMLIGVARSCNTMTELRDRMAELHGKHAVQMRFYLPLDPTRK